jgi:U3 small nucleolar RNA-associated protein 25
MVKTARRKTSQGIRKRRSGNPSRNKNDPNRQRLAKVAARHAEEGGTSSFDHYGNFDGTTKSATPSELTKVLRDKKGAPVSRNNQEPDSDDEPKGERRRRGGPTNAYLELIHDIRKTASGASDLSGKKTLSINAGENHVQGQHGRLFANVSPEDSTSRRHSITRSVKIGLQDGTSACSAKGSDEPAQRKTPEQELESRADLSGVAAGREAAHFGKVLSAEAAAALATSSFEFNQTYLQPGVGKVSWAVPSGSEPDMDTVDQTSNMYINALGLQPSVINRWHGMRSAASCSLPDADEPLSDLESTTVRALRSYRDVLLCKNLTPHVEESLRQIVIAHVLSHTIRARGRVVRNDQRRRDPGLEGTTNEDDMKDQGFSRPRALFLVPMRNDAYDIVRTLARLAVGTASGEKGIAQVANNDRFEEEFGADPDEEQRETDRSRRSDAPDDEEYSSEEANPTKAKPKPEDWRRRFRGNIDDDFKIGLALSKKSIKLYTDFYNSDIIVASPLGLVRSLEAKKSGNKTGKGATNKKSASGRLEDNWVTGVNEKDKRRDDGSGEDFLSSIEVCILDGANVFTMQNWSTLLSTMSMINNMPSSPGSTDFSRVRNWALDNQMRCYRQTVILSTHRKAEISSLFRQLRNHAGRVRVMSTPRKYGSMSDVAISVRQRFMRIENIHSLEASRDQRFDFFVSKVLPELRSSVDCQALVLIPNYFDFVRVRNHLVKLAADEAGTFRFGSICEYSKPNDVARARTNLFHGRINVLLITERFHYFWRYHIRGANSIVWYGLPENGHFYPEIVNFLTDACERGRPVQSLALYDMYDLFALDRIVGSLRSKRMTSPSSRSTFLFAE